VSEALEPSLGLAGQVLLELHVAGLVEHLEGDCVLVIKGSPQKFPTQLDSLHAG
jgi:hypothetical protein